MTAEAFEKWEAENSSKTISETINRIEYRFCTLQNGWIGVFEKSCTGEYTPIIQAEDLEHAHSYCVMLEPMRVPYNVI